MNISAVETLEMDRIVNLYCNIKIGVIISRPVTGRNVVSVRIEGGPEITQFRLQCRLRTDVTGILKSSRFQSFEPESCSIKFCPAADPADGIDILLDIKVVNFVVCGSEAAEDVLTSKHVILSGRRVIFPRP